MGAFAWWVGHSRHSGKLLSVLAIAGVAALAWDFRDRIAVAWVIAMVLGVARSRMPDGRSVLPRSPRLHAWIRAGARSSYALFLTHFSVWMLANALWANLGWVSVGALGFVTATAWVLCLLVATGFERYIERPLALVRI